MTLPRSTPLAEAPEYTVHPDPAGGYLRLHRDPLEESKPYATTRWDWPNRRILVDYLPEGRKFIGEYGNNLFHLGLEAILLHEDRLILHAACVDTPLGGLLFSGPSGVGKSTQGDLWVKHMGARLINGDRPILSRNENGWLAWGSPYAGSSRVHINASAPVRAIVLLRQASENALRRLAGREAFIRVFAGVTVNSWDAWCVNRACDLVTELMTAVPVYELSCTPTKEAVELLYAALTGGEAQ